MTSIKKALIATPLRTFAANYSPTYTSFILHHISQDQQHPLNIIRRRKERQRERIGLWWHVTVNANSSKTKVVQTRLRRRLRNAFIEELKAKSVDEDGKLIQNLKTFKHGGVIGDLLQQGQELSLKGSIRLHAKPELVTARYEQVRQESGKIVSLLLRGLEEELSKTVVQSSDPQQMDDKPHWSQWRRKPAARSSRFLTPSKERRRVPISMPE